MSRPDAGQDVHERAKNMTISLVEALRQVDLKGGQVYRCQIGRFRVEVRVDEAAATLLPTPLQASDIMLDPWTDLPAPPSASVVRATPGPPAFPDVPDLAIE